MVAMAERKLQTAVKDCTDALAAVDRLLSEIEKIEAEIETLQEALTRAMMHGDKTMDLERQLKGSQDALQVKQNLARPLAENHARLCGHAREAQIVSDESALDKLRADLPALIERQEALAANLSAAIEERESHEAAIKALANRLTVLRGHTSGTPGEVVIGERHVPRISVLRSSLEELPGKLENPRLAINRLQVREYLRKWQTEGYMLTKRPGYEAGEKMRVARVTLFYETRSGAVKSGLVVGLFDAAGREVPGGDVDPAVWNERQYIESL